MSEEEIAAVAAALKQQIDDAAVNCRFAREGGHASRKTLLYDGSDDTGPRCADVCARCAHWVDILSQQRAGVLLVLRKAREKATARAAA